MEADNKSTPVTLADSIAGENMTPQEITTALQTFNKRNALPVSRVELSPEEQQILWSRLEKLLRDHKEARQTILNTIKILSRNKDVVNKVLTRDFMDLLLTLAGFPPEEGPGGGEGVDTPPPPKSSRQMEPVDWDTILEACKVASNIYFQSTVAIGLCFVNKAVERIFRQMSPGCDQQNVPKPVIEFDFKILFLITAHCEEARTLARYSCDAFDKIISYVERTLEASLSHAASETSRQGDTAVSDNQSSKENKGAFLRSEDTTVISAALKVLVNLTHFMNTSIPSEDVEVDPETFKHFERMARMCQLSFTIETEDAVVREMMIRDYVHLLTNFPVRAMAGVLTDLDEDYVGPDAKSKEVRYLDTVINIPKIIFDHLMDTLQTKKPSIHSIGDSSTPILKVLCMLAAGYPHVRKYYRSLVLPPLEAVTQERPEEGDTPKAVLCRLLTSSDSTLSVMVAEFLFILCKESVRRMIKHTGYGNAAGLFARKGLLGGAKHVKESSNYSSSESDSDTEEYASNAHKVNPITGCADDSSRARPFEGMSEEQKEYEAVQLANLIDKLHTMGVVKPAKLGEDGKPHPVDHVLELCEAQATNQMGHIRENQGQEDDDSDKE